MIGQESVTVTLYTPDNIPADWHAAPVVVDCVCLRDVSR